MWKKNDPWKVRELNDRLMMAERAFTDPDGLFGRSWYKHLVSFHRKPAIDILIDADKVILCFLLFIPP